FIPSLNHARPQLVKGKFRGGEQLLCNALLVQAFMPSDPLLNRRPLASRRLGIMQRLASVLARSGVTPNQISVAGIVFALLAAAAFWQAAEGRAVGWLF